MPKPRKRSNPPLHVYVHGVERAMVAPLIQEVARIMTILSDIQGKVTELKATVAAQTQVHQSVVTLLRGLAAIIASLKQQLADAIANGADPAALQKVLDDLSATETTVETETKALADAAVENTPAT
jgi:uncharacterized protein YukE